MYLANYKINKLIIRMIIILILWKCNMIIIVGRYIILWKLLYNKQMRIVIGGYKL